MASGNNNSVVSTSIKTPSVYPICVRCEHSITPHFRGVKYNGSMYCSLFCICDKAKKGKGSKADNEYANMKSIKKTNASIQQKTKTVPKGDSKKTSEIRMNILRNL